MKWKDPRLAWEINEENCADYINVYTGRDQGETSISCCCCINQKQNKTKQNKTKQMNILFCTTQVRTKI